jgi:hypothetical protein
VTGKWSGSAGISGGDIPRTIQTGKIVFNGKFAATAAAKVLAGQAAAASHHHGILGNHGKSREQLNEFLPGILRFPVAPGGKLFSGFNFSRWPSRRFPGPPAGVIKM